MMAAKRSQRYSGLFHFYQFESETKWLEVNRYRRGLETCPQVKTSKSGHAIFYSFLRRVRATSMTQRRVENTRVHVWTFSLVSVKLTIFEPRKGDHGGPLVCREGDALIGLITNFKIFHCCYCRYSHIFNICENFKSYQVHGITSWKNKCKSAANPAVFAKVNAVRDWIKFTLSGSVLKLIELRNSG